jgi:AmmeMemoRadiSam system protein A
MGGTETPTGLSLDQRRTLLQLAREAISTKLQRGSVPETELEDADLCRLSGAFVTLEIDDRLRGCIGSMEPDKQLHRQVVEMAVAAATDDPRFDAMRPPELKFTEIEISVLSPMEPIEPHEVEVGTHGLYVAQGSHRGVFLPQVPVQHSWDRARYLKELLSKARLPPGAFQDPNTRLLAFTAEVFGDRDVLEDAYDE